MLIGEYNHNIDAKGRMNFPAKLREDLGDRFVITKGLDNCLVAYSLEGWLALEEKIKALSMSKGRTLQRFLFAGACEIQPDKQGRILIPANLRTYADLQKDVVVVGSSNKVEIWNKLNWEAECDKMTGALMAEVMEELDF